MVFYLYIDARGDTMPSWGELLQELQPHTSDAGETIPGLSFDELRTKYISLLSQKTGRNVIAYFFIQNRLLFI